MLQHEFRTPLSAAIMLLNELLTASLSAETLDILQTVLGSLSLLLSVVNGLLDFRSIQQGTFVPKQDTFQPAKVFSLAMNMFKQEAASTGTTLTYTVVPMDQFWEAQPAARISQTPTESTA